MHRQSCGRRHVEWAGPEFRGAYDRFSLPAEPQHNATLMVETKTLCSELLVAEGWVGKWAVERRMRLASEQLQ
eukprot:912011-Pleurochrysis_carterae.AAC.1